MARGRMLSTSISLSEQMADLASDTHRLLATWMLAHLDATGRCTGSPRQLCALVTPLLPVDPGGWQAALDDMARGGLVRCYQDADGQPVVQWPRFAEHQTGLRPDREAPSKFGEEAGSTPPQRAVSDAVIYFLQAGENGPVKIGVTVDLERRITQLQTGCSAPLRVLGTIPGGRTEEAAIHRRLASFAMEGEWLRPDPSVFSHVEDLLSGRVRTSQDVSARARAGALDFPSLLLASPDPDLSAQLVALWPELRRDVDGLLSEWTSAYPGLDYVQLAKEARAKARAGGTKVDRPAALLGRWYQRAWQEKRQATDTAHMEAHQKRKREQEAERRLAEQLAGSKDARPIGADISRLLAVVKGTT